MNIPMDSYQASREIASLRRHLRDDDLVGQACIAMLYAVMAAKHLKARKEFMP